MSESSWADCPTIFVHAIGCTKCGATRPIIVRTADNGDGSKTRRCICRECASRFNVCIELPESSNDAPDVL